MLNKKHIVIFLALLVACMSIAVAADTADTTTADSQVSDTIEADTTNTIQTQATTNANEDNNKITKENKKIKEDTTSTIPVDNDNFDDYFTNAGLTGVNDGDTITFTSDVTRTSNSYIINKQVNILGNNYTLDLNTINGYDNQNNPTYIEFNSQASNSNISYLKFHNTQVFTTNASNITFDNNIFYNPITIGDNSNVTNNTFKSDVTLYNNVNFKNNNAENSTLYVNGSNCDLCNNTIYKLVVNNAATNTTVCEDNIIDIISGAGNIVIVSHPTTQSNSNTPYSSILNKKYTQPIKSEGEPTIIDITAENIEEYFLKDEEAYFINRRAITSDCIIRLNSLPDTKGLLINNFAINKYNVTVVGSENLELNNLYLSFSYVDLTKNLIINYDENFEYNETLNGGVPLIMSAETDNITINYKPDMVEMKSITLGQTLKNSIINAEVPSVSNGYTLLNSEKSLQLINNNITIEEKYPYGENPSIIGILLQADTNTLTGNNITMNGESTLTAIKLNSNTNTITNNNITVTTTGTATGVEITGNDNTVKNNKISANDKTGDDAVTVTGENNIVENNTAVEMDTRIPTSIELNYDGTPIDVGQQLVIRGAFKAGKDETGAENIKVYDNNELITNINTIDDLGTITYVYTPAIGGSHNITFTFEGNDTCKNTSTTITVEVNEVIEPTKEYTLKVDTTEFTQGETTTITASIYYGDENEQEIATNISKGKVTFKVNGKTLKDTNGKVIYAKVINGTATIENYPIPETWKEGSTIQAVYSGSTDLEKMSSEKTEITITTTEPTITTEDITTQTGATITLKATINTDATINTGKVVFKINGKTIKDTNGKVIYAKVVNNEVTVEYTLPEEYTTGTYNITAVFISPDYKRLEDTKTLTITA